MNRIILVGRNSMEPTYTDPGNGKTPYSNFSVAVSRKRSKDEVDFFNCVAFGKTAEFVNKWFHKGDPIEVEGEGHIEKYNDKNGNPQKTFRVYVDNVGFVPRGRNQGNAQNDAEVHDDVSSGVFIDPNSDLDQLPFA